jgi:hypothetical protein
VILIPPWREKNLRIYGIKQIQRSPIAAPMNFIGTSESRNRTFVGRRGDLLRMTA